MRARQGHIFLRITLNEVEREGDGVINQKSHLLCLSSPNITHQAKMRDHFVIPRCVIFREKSLY
jgi:hypothetical protein